MAASGRPPTRVLVVNPSGALGGAEIVLDRLVDAATREQWLVTGLVPEGRLARRLRERGLTVHEIPDLKLPPGPKPLAILRGLVRTLRGARRLRRDAADHDAVVGNGLFTLPALMLARPRRPVIALVHDIVDRAEYRWIARLCRSAVRKVVVPSEAAAQPLRALGLEVTIVRNGTAWPVEAAPVHAPRPPVVGQLAALTPPKAQDLLLEAVASLGRHDVMVDLAGEALAKDERYVRALQDRAGRPDLRGRVRFLGRVEDPLAVQRGWSVATLPSTYPESFGLALLEAMSIGVPVVATDHGGPPDVVGDAGLLVPPGDVPALAAAIERLLDDEALRRRCRAAGPRLVESTYTIERQQQALLDLVRDLTRSAPSAATADRP